MIYDSVLCNLGNTPMIKLCIEEQPALNVYAKMEFMNPTGSVKDRAASYVLKSMLNAGVIDQDTEIVESSSGNFGIALGHYCRYYGLKFHCVIDSNICLENENLVKMLSYKTYKIAERDHTGGYLLNRIKKVNQLISTIPNSYWINQYSNLQMGEAYYKSLGKEICESVAEIDYVFMAVSSGGTILGVSRCIKERFPNAKVIAVDIKGSVIFGNPPEKRTIPGMGSSMVPELVKHAFIDEIMIVDEPTIILSCHEFFYKYNILAGGSSGAVLAAIKSYFANKDIAAPLNVVTVLPDRGDRYVSTIYNEAWFSEYLQVNEMK
ncbi:2,3-diaminopropionate biosynthesis protein SbnA [Paenibacillus sp. JCM 10914]|uniref:2,3-diaminopropionate biosynthesis protein SbnA n=1 Tax=Paenibacillus sp. JCM 10914 TaxID=1236974 RepID=UPI0003CC7541|nr:2,3-diaminopropionate biosynthesis protein SbnA [Paenibacillus sp. JCM 10914]GAE10042.1 cysteine synthase [Paenibacillus sp. JCM 10914]